MVVVFDMGPLQATLASRGYGLYQVKETMRPKETFRSCSPHLRASFVRISLDMGVSLTLLGGRS